MSNQSSSFASTWQINNYSSFLFFLSKYYSFPNLKSKIIFNILFLRRFMSCTPYYNEIIFFFIGNASQFKFVKREYRFIFAHELRGTYLFSNNFFPQPIQNIFFWISAKWSKILFLLRYLSYVSNIFWKFLLSVNNYILGWNTK